MHIWRLSKTLTDRENPEWEILLSSTFGDEVHPDRKHGFLLSRDALRNCLKELSLGFQVLDLKVTDNHLLPKYPDLTISLSHTKDLGAALIGERKRFRALGIDIEREDRVVKDMVIERVSHPNDIKMENIDRWCLKEAIFKTLMNSGEFNDPVEFSSIEIGEKRWTHSPTRLEGEWELERVTPYVVARAFLKI